ncbi:MAG: aldolase/citrate lyase family protein [Mycobacteriales bacterium]
MTTWLSNGDAYTAEVLGHCGYDAVTVDLQHGMFGVESAIACLQAISSTPAAPLVRCRSNDAGDIGHLLDAGAYGVICPGIDTVADAERFVAACRYPPTGRRSFGPSRGLLYGGSDYVQHADSTVLTIAMIESTTGLSNLDAILAVAGLDAIYVGPNDLAVSAGWELLGVGPVAPELAACLQLIVSRARAAGVPAGVFAMTGDQAVQFADWGFQLLTPGNDVGLLRAESARRLAMLRPRA